MSRSVFINNEILGLERDENESYFIVESVENANIITQYIKDNNIYIRRGDIIDTIKYDNRYRNDGKFIWDGENAIFLECDIDDYGAIPKSFIVSPNEFSPKYWEKTICHNNYYWPYIEYRKQVVDSLIYDDKFTEEKKIYGCFKHDDKIIYVILEIDLYLYINMENITQYIKDNNVSIRKGDIIDINIDKKFIWDGEKVILLESINFGTVPKSFMSSHNEFFPNIWNETIRYNNTINLIL